MATKETIWSYNFIALFVTNAVMFFGQNMMSTLLPVYLNGLGIGSAVIGVVMGMFSVTALGTRPITGPLIDSMNKKTLYIAMLVILAFACIGYAFAVNIWLLSFFRLLHGISMGCSSALALTLVTDTLPPDKLASGLGVYGMSGILPMAFGPGAGLAIKGIYGYEAAFAFSGLLVIVSIVITSRLRITHTGHRRINFRPGSIIAREAVIPSLFILLISLSRAGLMTFLVLYINEYRQIAGISVYFLINAGVLLISRPLYGKIADKYGFAAALIPSYFFLAAMFVTLAVCTQTWQLWLAGVFNALGLSPAFSTHQALVMKSVRPERRGAASTTSFAGLDVGDLIGPTLAGVIIQTAGYPAMFLLSMIPLGLCAVGFFVWSRRRLHAWAQSS